MTPALLVALGAVVSAWAQPASARVAPVAEPPGVEAAYAAWAASQGRASSSGALVCRSLAEQLELCFTWLDDGRLRRVTQAELQAWTTSAVVLERHATVTARAALTADRLVAQTVPDMPGKYFTSSAGDGLDAAVLLAPERLAALVGEGAVVGLPDDKTLVTWLPGDAELDKVLAVAVQRMYQASDHPVSPLLYTWHEGAWTVWGELKAAGDAPQP